MKEKVLVIVGATASGKSDLAVKLAKRLNGEVVSADSRQVYRGLDIGTGKITHIEMKGVRHHLLDVSDPRRRFTAEKYRIFARQAIADIHRRGKLPIITGGTGFYIDAIFNGSAFPAVKPDLILRKRLSKKSLPQLLAILKKLDRKRWSVIDSNDSDKKNARRLIRAIEVAHGSERRTYEIEGWQRAAPYIQQANDAPTEANRIAAQPTPLHDNYDIRFIGIKVPPLELKARIRTRLLKRLKGGLTAEVRRLHEPRSARNPNGGLSWKRLDELGLEYRYVARYLQDQLTRDEIIKKLTTEIGRYAKRQMTWWIRNKRIAWIDPKDMDKKAFFK